MVLDVLRFLLILERIHVWEELWLSTFDGFLSIKVFAVLIQRVTFFYFLNIYFEVFLALRLLDGCR